MAFGANSKIFTQFLNSVMENFTAVNLSTDTPKVALYDLTNCTPDQNAVVASTAYAVGQWITGTTGTNEVWQATHWPAGGMALGSTTHVAGTATWTYDAADTASADASATLVNIGGCMVYDDTLAAGCVNEGICFNSFGGAQSVTAGTFTVVWNASGIFQITL